MSAIKIIDLQSAFVANDFFQPDVTLIKNNKADDFFGALAEAEKYFLEEFNYHLPSQTMKVKNDH